MKIPARKPEVSSYNKIIKETDCGESFDVRRSSLLVRGGTTTVEKVCTYGIQFVNIHKADKAFGVIGCLCFASVCGDFLCPYYLECLWKL